MNDPDLCVIWTKLEKKSHSELFFFWWEINTVQTWSHYDFALTKADLVNSGVEIPVIRATGRTFVLPIITENSRFTGVNTVFQHHSTQLQGYLEDSICQLMTFLKILDPESPGSCSVVFPSSFVTVAQGMEEALEPFNSLQSLKHKKRGNNSTNI